MSGLRVIVCGGRNYDSSAVWNWLERNAVDMLGERIAHVIHGGASGADEGAHWWAISEENCSHALYAANWKKHGKSAGPRRNQRMLDEGKPDAVIAFPGGRGTADMVRRAKSAGVRVIEVVT